MFSYAQGPFAQPHTFTAPGMNFNPYTINPGLNYNPYATAQAPVYGMNPDTALLLTKITELQAQLLATNEILRTALLKNTQGPTTNFTNGAAPYAGAPNYAYGATPVVPFQRPNGLNAADTNPIRFRESDTHLFCDIFLSQLTIGDVEVETSGNRILCRTRVPVAPFNRWNLASAQLPRGFEIFELPDGRIEYCWLCPVAFQAKEIEASFKEGFLCICIPKAETTAHRHSVKVVKEQAGRRAASDMNS